MRIIILKKPYMCSSLKFHGNLYYYDVFSFNAN